MADIGKGIATVGIWVGVGLCAFAHPVAGIIVSVLAMVATGLVWGR